VPEASSPEQARIINENFRRLRDAIDRAAQSGGLIGLGTITLAMLAPDVKALVGDVTGTIGSSGSTTVGKIQGKAVAVPVGGDDGQFARYNSGAGTITWETPPVQTSALLDGSVHTDTVAASVAKGALVVGNATPKWDKLAVGSDATVLQADSAQTLGVKWSSVSALLDGIGSTRGSVLYRGASGWAELTPGTAGKFLESQGAGLDPIWGTAGGGALTSPLTTKGDIWGFSTVDAAIAVGSDGKVLTADSTQALGVKWATIPASTNALLDGSAHTDTAAGTVVRGDVIVGNSTPKWARLALGTVGRVLRSDGTDSLWARPGYLVRRCLVYQLSLGGGSAVTGGGILGSTNQGGTEADAAESGAGTRYCNKYTQAVSAGKTGRAITSATMKAERSPAMAFDFKIVAIDSGTGRMHFFGGFSGASIFSDNTATSPSRVGIKWTDGTDTNLQLLTCNATAVTSASTGIAKDTAWHDCLLWTPDNGTTWNLEIDGVLTNSTTTNVPVTTTTLQAGVGFRCVGTATVTTPEIHNSYQHAWEGPL
jgi:hypothetical protein